MKHKSFVLVSLFALVFIGAVSIQAQTTAKPDLSMRTALYFTGDKTNKIDLATDKYVVSDATMELNTNQAVSCDGTYCEFNIGFIAFGERAATSGSLSTYALFTVDNGSMVGNTVYFAAQEQTKQGVHKVKLKMGMNRVTFTIDPYEKVAESNEDNNSFSVNFKVTRQHIVIPGK